MAGRVETLGPALHGTLEALSRAVEGFAPGLSPQEIGRVRSVGKGIVRVSGLPGAGSEELLAFSGGLLALALNIDSDEVGAVLLGEAAHLGAGDEARRTGRVLDVPVGDALIGRVVDPVGRERDGGGPLRYSRRVPVERPAPEIMDRAPVEVPLRTGLKVIDALIPVGRGQRELILGDRQTGKTALAVDTIISQGDQGVLCFYCAIGQRSSGVARVIAELRERGAMRYTTVVAAEADQPAGLKYIAPYAATAMAEHFVDQGRDALVVYDDLTQHARAYREISLLLRRPPGREAFPGDIFYVHSRLLERSTRLRGELGGGSLTALPIVETEAQNVAAYIPTNLISITDGQIYLSPDLFQKGLLPAVDVGKSVSRVGGKAQLAAYRAVAGDLRLSYAQFEELEVFSRFGTRLDEDTRKTLNRGRRVRMILRQPRSSPMSVSEQVLVLCAATRGAFDAVDEEDMWEAETAVRGALRDLSDLGRRIEQGSRLSQEDLDAMERAARAAVRHLAREEEAP